VHAADYPEAGAGDYVLQTLWERRAKVLAYFLRQVTPLDALGVENGRLRLQDMGKRLAGLAATGYEVQFLDADGHPLDSLSLPAAADDQVDIAIPAALAAKTPEYLRVDVRAHWQDAVAPVSAQFHLRRSGQHDLRLVGIVH
jgi:hypothetical protein